MDARKGNKARVTAFLGGNTNLLLIEEGGIIYKQQRGLWQRRSPSAERISGAEPRVSPPCAPPGRGRAHRARRPALGPAALPPGAGQPPGARSCGQVQPQVHTDEANAAPAASSRS